ncbi:MAG: two-component system, OmpR family, sensor histidine kinase SenX3 [Actinomycetota bacterium]|nr:two-component system, OmpR family, sensor histidine kinase SenX3 [Actinomycetota bacterium]
MKLRGRRPEAEPPVPPVPGRSKDMARVLEAISALPVGVLVEDEAGRTVAANDRARSPIGDVQGDALAADVIDRVRAAARLGRRAEDVLDLRGPPVRVLEITAVPLTAGGVAAVIVDTSERRRLDAIRRDFVANVNHELRTPIGALGLLADALAEETDGATVRRLASRISLEAERAGALITELLDFSRVEADESGVREALVVDDVVASAADRVSALAEQRSIAVVLPSPSSGLAVTGDRLQLVSAVSNLLDNAVNYSDAGSTVTVSVESSSAGEGGWVDVVVRDEGIGIPARDLDRIFERFYRVDRARDRRTGGTGLGLAIVRHVAANHEGEVMVESLEGEGSAFTLRLPAASS